MPLPCQRALFDIPDGVTYLNCASQSPALKESHAAGQRGLLRKLHPWDGERTALAGEMERCRALFGGLIGAAAEEISICFSTSYGMATAAANLPLAPGQEILALESQFPSNVYAWQRLAERAGGRVRFVRRGADFDWTSAVLEAIGERTGILALPNCHWSDGSLVDLVPIAAECRARGIPLVLDATQSAGAAPFDLARVPADFIVASGYKWLLSPDTLGFMYVAPKWRGGEPLELNQQGRDGAPSMETGDGLGGGLALSARRFDMGAADSMVLVPMAEAALARIRDWGVETIAASLAALVDLIAERAEARGWRMPPKSRRIGHFIGLYPPEALPADFPARLAARHGVHVALRNGVLRVSPYLYNEPSDIDRLFAAIDTEAAR